MAACSGEQQRASGMIKDTEKKPPIDLTPAKSAPPPQAEQTELRCQFCQTPAPGALCGRKSPCPGCGYPYPLGDCSDLAAN